MTLEIDSICTSLIRHGLSDSQPGHVGLDRLRKLAQAQFLVSAIPTLPTLVPFLELSNNQEYLVKRIKVLANGGSMSEFKWNGGGSHNSKEWDSSLPTDSAVSVKLNFFLLREKILGLKIRKRKCTFFLLKLCATIPNESLRDTCRVYLMSQI